MLAAFLEAMNQIGPSDRMTFRLYSETRRRALRSRRQVIDAGWRRCTIDVAALSTGEVSVDVRVDEARILLLADALPPEPGESPAAYLERLAPSLSVREERRRRARLRSHRIASFAELREAFRRITRHPHLTETPE